MQEIQEKNSPREAAWERYCSAIMQGGYTDVPTRTGFSLYLAENGQDTAFAGGELTPAMESVRQDVLLAGAMLKHYQTTPAMAILKTDGVTPLTAEDVDTRHRAVEQLEEMVRCEQARSR